MPSIALASGKNVYVVWTDINFDNIINPSLGVLFKKSTDGGNTFTPAYPNILSSGTGLYPYPPPRIAAITVYTFALIDPKNMNNLLPVDPK